MTTRSRGRISIRWAAALVVVARVNRWHRHVYVGEAPVDDLLAGYCLHRMAVSQCLPEAGLSAPMDRKDSTSARPNDAVRSYMKSSSQFSSRSWLLDAAMFSSLKISS